MTKNLIGFVYNPKISASSSLVRSLIDDLNIENSWVGEPNNLGVTKAQLASTSTIVTAGGDGTILRTIRSTLGMSIPILGINMGRVGFMTELTVSEAPKLVPEYLFGNPTIETRMMLEGHVTGIGSFHSLNDIVVARGTETRLLDIKIIVDDGYVTTYRADGVVIATETGSTAYALAAGGPVVHPKSNVILVQPIAPHNGLRTGLVLPSDSLLNVSIEISQEGVVTVDGFADAVLSGSQTVIVKKSNHVARFLRSSTKTGSYYNLSRSLGFDNQSQRKTSN